MECLEALGARKVFGVPGESYLAVLDGFHDTAGRLDFVPCRNEGGAAFMAAAWGKLTGAPGLAFVTRGPGATNASIGVHTAMQDSVPMILFVGQVGTDMLGREAFQEIDYRAFYGSVAKWVCQIDDPARIPELTARAWSTARSGRPGPVVVALPENVLRAAASASALPDSLTLPGEPAPDPASLVAAQKSIAEAERPLILLGGSGWTDTGRAAIQAFAEASEIPVLAAFRFQDIFDNHSLCYAGDAGVGMTPETKRLIRDADVILALNIRFGEITTDGYQLLNVPLARQRIIHCHISDRELGKIYIPHIALHAGPNAISEALVPVKGNRGEWRAEARAGFEAGFDLPEQPGPVDMRAVMAHLQAKLPDNAIITNGAGNFATWPNRIFRFGAAQRLLAPQSGAMGFGLPAAIAAKIAAPDRTVVCFTGDGDFQMSCQELGTAMQEEVNPIILILNNGSYGTIRMHQERNFPSRVSGTDLVNPDFPALAGAYGFHGEKVTRTQDFAPALERALATNKGAVLDLATGIEALTPRQTLARIKSESRKRQD